MANTEYRVVWKREGKAKKSAIFQRRSTAIKRYLFLRHDSPWSFLHDDGDSVLCCSGYQCGCEGVTVREHYENQYRDIPKIEFVRLETRQVSKWETDSEDDPMCTYDFERSVFNDSCQEVADKLVNDIINDEEGY